MNRLKNNAMIPVSEPDISDLEIEHVTKAVKSGWVSSIGEYIDLFENEFAQYCGTEYGIAVSNGTDALMLALRAFNIGRGDEVIIPGLTFAAVPAVVKHVGAEPVLVDVDPEYYCINPRLLERAITKKTKAIIVVHLYGHPSNMGPIMEIAGQYNIKVIEDCAEAHGAKYNKRNVGSIGHVGCFSFYGNKIMTTGEGGAVVTDDKEINQKIRFLKDHAMVKGMRYYHTEAGYNCRMTNLQAALGYAQLNRIEELQERRRDILNAYKQYIPEELLGLNPNMEWADPVNWLVIGVLNESSPKRDNLIAFLKNEGIDTRPFFVSINELPPYSECRKVGFNKNNLCETNRLSKRGINLPTSTKMSIKQVKYISEKLIEGIQRL